MMRIIPRLDIKGPNLVKGIHMEGLRVLGKPEDFARYYYETGADELIYQDAVASLYGRNSLLDIVTRTAKEIFIPLAVGGGLRSIEDIRTVLCAGADKVILNTAAVERPEFIAEAARIFGSSTIVIAIDAVKNSAGTYEVYTHYGKERTSVDAVRWAAQAAEIGAGEIVVTCISQEGAGAGFDIQLTKTIAEKVSIPVIANGGAGAMPHIYEVIEAAPISAVSLASMLHYEFVMHYDRASKNFSEEGNVDFLMRNDGFLKVNRRTIQEIKLYLASRGVNCRL